MTTVLVIEEASVLREEILQMLALVNFCGISAADGSAGVKLAQQHLPDIIICGVELPKIGGFAVLQTLRRNPETARIPFILLTAKADRADIRRGMNLGADDYLIKPVCTNELLEAISARLYKQAAITIPYVIAMRQAAEQIGQLAFRDALTGLPNRILFQQRLQEAVTQAKRASQDVMVCCLNVECFRAINLRFGRSAGDDLLQAIATRLTNCLAPQDTVARLSSDEFAVLIQIAPDSTAANTTEKLLKSLSVPYQIQDEFIPIQVQMGATLYSADSSSAPNLLNHAILALNWIRRQGNLGCQFYSAEIGESIANRTAVAAALQGAIARSELQIHYQPQVNLVTGRIIGAEASVCWQSPDLGTISPATLLSVAEEAGLMESIGQWLLQAACTQAKIWQTKHLLPLRTAINLSSSQFNQPALIQTIAQILEETQLDAELLAIELTEATIMADVEASLLTLQQLKALGIYVSIDSFGTGYSSLSSLPRLPIDALKIDRSFVQQMPADPHAAAIAASITVLARSLNLRVVAEGVETQEQLNCLRRQGCNAIQGDLFSPAISESEFEQLLAGDRRLALA
jgi:diguanylate cyclase